MPWRPLESTAFAICVYPFQATQPDDLPLQIGDQIYVIEEGGIAGEWYRGYLVAFPSLLAGLTSNSGEQLDARVFSGIFPRNCVEVRELVDESKIGKESETPLSAVSSINGERPGDEKAHRRSQASRLSRALSRKKSNHSIVQRTPKRPPLPQTNLVRDPSAPKPIAPVPLLRVGDETGLSAEEPLVDEIASCLREWHDARLHEVVLARGYGQLARVQELIKRIDTSRKQLMHDFMTMKELNTLREDTVWDLVAGNKLLSDEVIVRSPTEKGRILTTSDSIIDMTREQANMSMLDRPPKPTVDLHMLHHVLVDVRTLVCEQEQPATLQIYLCAKDFGERARPVSETYAISLPIISEPQTAQEQSKSLFINLSTTDIGIGADTSSLYVVFKLLKDSPIRPMLSVQAEVYEATAPLTKTTSNSGRRSVFGAPRKRDSHSRHRSDASTRPGTSASERSEIVRASKLLPEQPDTHPGRTVKRAVGIGSIKLNSLLQQRGEIEQSVTLWTPSYNGEDGTGNHEDWNEVNRELVISGHGTYVPLDTVKRFDVFMAAFASPDLDALVRNTPTLLHNIHTTERLGFTGVPTHKRSDIYVTLNESIIPTNAHLAHAKFGKVPLTQRTSTSLANLQLTLEVRRANGERIENCISTAANHSGHTAWRTTAVEKGESWNQTIRLAVPPQDVPGSHIVMSIADSPNFPFALAWVPLWEADAFVRDGEHQAALYVYDEYSSSIIGGKGAYLALPPWHNRSDPIQANAATVSLRTFLCSTQHSQDPNLLGLLSWREFHGEKLIELLTRFSFVPEIEIVKLLSDIFAALFEVLEEYAGDEQYEDLVFQNFVVIMGITRDRRFGLQNVIEDYATTRQNRPSVSKCLLHAYKRLLTNPLNAESSRKLRAGLKVGDQMLKLIIETGSSSPSDQTDADSATQKTQLLQDLHNVFVSLMALMRNPLPVLLGTQTLVVQHFHAWLPELATVMAPADVLEIATDLLDAGSHASGKLILYRLVLIINYSRLDVFKTHEVRTTLVAHTFRWLVDYWGHTDSVTPQWRNQVRLCCSVVATQMQHLGEEGCQYIPKLVESYNALEKAERQPVSGFSMLFPTSFPFPARPANIPANVDEVLLEISALLAAALTSERRLYFDANQVDVMGVLQQSMKVSQSILRCEAFPKSWLSLHVSHHRFSLLALEKILDILIESLPDVFAPDTDEALDFNTSIWRVFFDTLFAAVGSPALAMETFPEQKRRAIWKIAGDVREYGANMLRKSWRAIGWETDEVTKQLHGFDRMGGYQVQFVPDLVAPVVQLCLSVHASLRTVAVEVLRSMIIGVWELDQELGLIQTAMIDCLDEICRTKSISEAYSPKDFVREMMDGFEPLRHSVENELYYAISEMFSRIEELLEMLTNVHRGGPDGEASKIVDTLHLMEFLRDVQSGEAHVRYVHQLTNLQIAANNHTEAGLALRLHADRYQWDPLAHVEAITEFGLPAQSAFERKEALMFQICHHFEKGQSWQRALSIYRELAEQYEYNIFDFNKLGRCQKSMASIHEKIAKGDRKWPHYYRVAYRGLGFPSNLRDKEYIFEGYHSDRLATFEDRLQQLYPAAQILRQHTEPEVEGQYLQVWPVSAHKDLNHTVYQRTKVSVAAREHSLLSNPRQFTITTRHPASDVPITEQVVEKIIYTTAESFPTILRRSEIIKTGKVTMSPIEAAVERTTRKTQELLALDRRISAGDEKAMPRISEDLLLSVDPSSDSSVTRYRSLLPRSASNDTDSIDGEDEETTRSTPAMTSMQNALRVALFDHALAVRRCLGLYNNTAYAATKAELVPRFEASFAPEIAILFPNNAGLFDDSSRRSSMTAREPSIKQPTEPPSSSAGVPPSPSNDESQREDDDGRQGRRRGSFSFMGRDGGSRAPSRQRSRSRSRLRSNSLARRISFFRLGASSSSVSHPTASAGPISSTNSLDLKDRPYDDRNGLRSGRDNKENVKPGTADGSIFSDAGRSYAASHLSMTNGGRSRRDSTNSVTAMGTPVSSHMSMAMSPRVAGNGGMSHQTASSTSSSAATGPRKLQKKSSFGKSHNVNLPTASTAMTAHE